MDADRFDRMTLSVARVVSRRGVLRGAAAGLAALGLGATLAAEAEAAPCVKPGKNGCKGPKNKKCCKGAECQGGSTRKRGRCVCKGHLTQCGRTCVNVRNDTRHCSACNRACGPETTCQQGACVGQLGCPIGHDICENLGNPLLCPDSDDPSCNCTTDIEGIPRCMDRSFGFDFRDDCTSNDDCNEGWVCTDPSACELPVEGNACVRVSTCGGAE